MGQNYSWVGVVVHPGIVGCIRVGHDGSVATGCNQMTIGIAIGSCTRICFVMGTTYIVTNLMA